MTESTYHRRVYVGNDETDKFKGYRYINPKVIENRPNEKCACGSGKKQKKCCPFGSPIFGPFPENDLMYYIPPKRSKEDIAKLMAIASMFGGVRLKGC